ncbi:MAG: DUF1508 domain-containing protein [Actinomycetota bacterium]
MPEKTLEQRAAEALEIDVDDVLGSRLESDGNLIAVTRFGEKVRIPKGRGEIELLVGPGAQPELFDPPEISEDAAEDLPQLDQTQSPAAAEAGQRQRDAAAEDLEVERPEESTGELKATDPDPDPAVDPEGDPEGDRKDRFEVFKGEDGKFYFRRIAPNGEIVASSEAYQRQKDAIEEASSQAAAEGLEVEKV